MSVVNQESPLNGAPRGAAKENGRPLPSRRARLLVCLGLTGVVIGLGVNGMARDAHGRNPAARSTNLNLLQDGTSIVIDELSETQLVLKMQTHQQALENASSPTGE